MVHATTFGVRPALAVVAAHGLTDLGNRGWEPHYALWLTAPIPSALLAPVFCAASVVHFAEDVGGAGSVLVHALVLVAGLLRGQRTALRAMLGYLACAHVPLHYRRCWRRRRFRALAIAGAGTLLALFSNQRMSDEAVFVPLLQRVAVAHISFELSLSLSLRVAKNTE